MNSKALTLLLIDDDEIERLKFRRVCSKNNYPHTIIDAKNGEDALSKLEETTPSLILLDLNMPKMNGFEFLKTLKSNDTYKYIPVIIMSSSNNYSDVKEAYRIGIAGYLIKPLKYEDYSNNIILLLNYWNMNELIN